MSISAFRDLKRLNNEKLQRKKPKQKKAKT